MERHEILDKLEEIQLSNYKTFKGSNEADLMTREDIADFIIEQRNLGLDENEFQYLKELVSNDMVREIRSKTFGGSNLSFEKTVAYKLEKVKFD